MKPPKPYLSGGGGHVIRGPVLGFYSTPTKTGERMVARYNRLVSDLHGEIALKGHIYRTEVRDILSLNNSKTSIQNSRY